MIYYLCFYMFSVWKFRISTFFEYAAVKAVIYATEAMQTISNYTCIQFRQVDQPTRWSGHVLLFTGLEPRFFIQTTQRNPTYKCACVRNLKTNNEVYMALSPFGGWGFLP